MVGWGTRLLLLAVAIVAIVGVRTVMLRRGAEPKSGERLAEAPEGGVRTRCSRLGGEGELLLSGDAPVVLGTAARGGERTWVGILRKSQQGWTQTVARLEGGVLTGAVDLDRAVGDEPPPKIVFDGSHFFSAYYKHAAAGPRILAVRIMGGRDVELGADDDDSLSYSVLPLMGGGVLVAWDKTANRAADGSILLSRISSDAGAIGSLSVAGAGGRAEAPELVQIGQRRFALAYLVREGFEGPGLGDDGGPLEGPGERPAPTTLEVVIGEADELSIVTRATVARERQGAAPFTLVGGSDESAELVYVAGNVDKTTLFARRLSALGIANEEELASVSAGGTLHSWMGDPFRAVVYDVAGDPPRFFPLSPRGVARGAPSVEPFLEGAIPLVFVRPQGRAGGETGAEDDEVLVARLEEGGSGDGGIMTSGVRLSTLSCRMGSP